MPWCNGCQQEADGDFPPDETEPVDECARCDHGILGDGIEPESGYDYLSAEMMTVFRAVPYVWRDPARVSPARLAQLEARDRPDRDAWLFDAQRAASARM